MTKPAKASTAAITFVAIGLGLGLTGCGSDADQESSASSSSASSSAAPSSSAAAAPSADASADISTYLKSEGITETPVKRGDPGAPVVELPVPPGWADAGATTPPGAWQAVVFADPAAAGDPAMISATVARLTGGEIDSAAVLAHAPNDLLKLPEFTDLSAGSNGPPAELAGFPAKQAGGTYTKDGGMRLIGQKTLTVPAADGNGVFLIKVIADANEQQIQPLATATEVIDQQTKITP